MIKTKLGIIGGSGLYQFPQLQNAEWIHVQSPWGEVSDDLLFGKIDDLEVVFLPRHGRKHHLSPSYINYRANIDALKRAGVTDIISVSACGSLREDLPPGAFLLVDQFIDMTKSRNKSFFGNGIVAHVSFAEPVSQRLADQLSAVMTSKKVQYQAKGTYVCIEGPQFSTKAESQLYRSWGCDVIGMTNLPEVQLAREAEIPYATLAMVTDYDCWHPDHENVDVQQVVKVLLGNAAKAKNMIKNLIENFEDHIDPNDPTNNCLDVAIITAPEKRTKKTLEKLKTVAGRVLNK